SLVAQSLRGSSVVLGAQDVYCEKEGAFTGEVSPTMLLDVGCRYVIIGHSERRHLLGETDGLINRKVQAALAAGLHVIWCVGGTLQEGEGARAEAVWETQVSGGLAGVAKRSLAHLVIAYEPVWAIGTGRNATPDQAEQAHAFLRRRIGEKFG